MKTKIANKGNNKKGISLIVLIITIIVMIILAGAVILSISNTNILDRAEQAVDATDLKQVQTLASTLWADAYLNGARTQEDLEKAVMDGLKKAMGETKLDNYTVTVTESWVTVERKKPEITLDTELSTDKLSPTVVESTSYTLSGKVTDKDGIKSFTINGTEVTVNEDGTWSTTLTLTQNEVKEITIIATNNNGDATTKVGYVGYIVYTNFTITSSNRSKIGYTDATTELVIPETFYDTEDGKWYKVTSIYDNAVYKGGAFFNCDNLTSVTIPDSMTCIGDYAFRECSSLTSVTIPNSVTRIGDSAFNGCSSLTSVTIPDSVKEIYNSAFNGCSSLTNVTIPDSVTRIGDNAFYNCSSLASVTLPNSVTSIGYQAFYECSSLTSVTIPNSVTSIGQYAFRDCDSLINVIISDGVTSIYDSMFLSCDSLTSVTIPNSVTSIGKSAFHSCKSLTSVTIPDSVTSIGSYAFYNCDNLASVTIPDSVTSIGEDAFRSCSSLTTINVDSNNSVYCSKDGVLYNKNMTTLIKCPEAKTVSTYIIPDGVTRIGDSAFDGCSSLTSVTIPDSVTDIGPFAFYECSSLTTLTIGSGVTSIGGYAFNGCRKLTSVTFKNTTGWWVSTSSTATSGTDVDVTDASTAATCLRSTYYRYYWFRSE